MPNLLDFSYYEAKARQDPAPGSSPEQLDAEAARGPITPTGQALPEGLFVPTGTPLEVQWNQSFYRATNKTQYGDGTLAVHYEGWSDSFDEIVEPERVRLSEQAIVAARGPVEGSGPTLDAESPVYAGDVIEVRWRDAYYRAVVRATHPDGRLRVHYAGWPEAWDEDVPRERARRVLSAGD